MSYLHYYGFRGTVYIYETISYFISTIIMNTFTGEAEQCLTPAQIGLRDISAEILSLKPEGNPRSFWSVPFQVDPHDVERKLKESSIADIMLKDGDSLSSIEPIGQHTPELGLYIGQAQLICGNLTAWLWELENDEWSRQVDIRLRYTNGENQAMQVIALITHSFRPGSLPLFMRSVYAPAYMDMGYEGHKQVTRSARDEDEALMFVGLVRETFKTNIT
jgi:hypothetical protein